MEWLLIFYTMNMGPMGPHAGDVQIERHLSEEQCIGALNSLYVVRSRFGAACVGPDGTVVDLIYESLDLPEAPTAMEDEEGIEG